MKKKILTLILMLTLFITPVYAENSLVATNCIDGPDGTNCGETIKENYDEMVTKADDNVTYNGKADGSVILAGNFVTYDGENDGIQILAGNDVTSKGYSEYAFIAGNTINLQAAYIAKDAYIAGNIIKVDATVDRDIVIFASDVTLMGSFGRNVTIYASRVTLDNAYINGNVKIESEYLTVKDEVEVKGKLKFGSDSSTISEKAKISEKEEFVVNHVDVSIASTLKTRALSYASMLFVFVILALAIPSSLKKVGDEELSFLGIITYIGYALVFLILVPMFSIILMLLTIGFPVALMLLAIYFMVIYLSYAYMGYYIGKKIWLTKNNEENVLLEGLIGITILYAVSLIPTVGPIITSLAYLCGIGIIIFKFKK